MSKIVSACFKAALLLGTAAVFTPLPADAGCVCRGEEYDDGVTKCYIEGSAPNEQQKAWCESCGWEYVNTGKNWFTSGSNYCTK